MASGLKCCSGGMVETDGLAAAAMATSSSRTSPLSVKPSSVSRAANHDEVTGLANRTQLLDLH